MISQGNAGSGNTTRAVGVHGNRFAADFADWIGYCDGNGHCFATDFADQRPDTATTLLGNENGVIGRWSLVIGIWHPGEANRVRPTTNDRLLAFSRSRPFEKWSITPPPHPARRSQRSPSSWWTSRRRGSARGREIA